MGFPSRPAVAGANHEMKPKTLTKASRPSAAASQQQSARKGTCRLQDIRGNGAGRNAGR
jgi:hypothetical protein